LRQRLDRKKRAPFTDRSLYKIEHLKLILNASRPAAEATLQAHRASLTASLPAGCALNSILAPYACLSSLEPNRIARDTRGAPFVDVLFSDITESGEVLDLGELAR